MKQVKESTKLTVSARAPFAVYFEGIANVVSAVNSVGPFDVLPGHADFFSVLAPCEVIIERDGEDPVKFEAHNGIITVRDDEVLLFANI